MHLKPDSSLRRHAHPVCQLAYNSVYQEAISADESGLICVWKVQSGAISRVPMHASLHDASSRRPVSVYIMTTGTPHPPRMCSQVSSALMAIEKHDVHGTGFAQITSSFSHFGRLSP